MTIEIDGYHINYKISGSGPETAVMLQGWGTTLEMYDSVAAAISDCFTFIQLDFPGFGSSDEPREPWNVERYGDFFCRFLETLGIRRCMLIGHSYGGRVIIRLAAREDLPFEISRIILIDSAGILPKKTWQQKWKVRQYKLLKKLFDKPWMYALFPEVIDDWKSRQGSADYRSATPMMRKCLVMAVNEDLTDLLPKIRQDTLLIWGDQDTATPIGDARLMEERIPSAGLVVLEGTGHFSFLEQPVRFRSILRAYCCS